MIKKIVLDDTQKDFLFTNLDSEGHLTCLKAFKVARLIGVKPKDMAEITKAYGVKITNCELGVFGKLKFSGANLQTYKNLSQNYMGNKRLQCKVIWDEARNSTLKTVGSTIKNSDIEVTHCQLGCFRERNGHNTQKIS